MLRIGFTTAEVNERTDLRPLNLVLVIDKRLDGRERQDVASEGELYTMLGKLRADDIVSIVAFDTTAQVLHPHARSEMVMHCGARLTVSTQTVERIFTAV